MLGTSTDVFLKGKSFWFYNLSCEKTYLYPSSLKKHYTVTHKEEYEEYLKEKQSKFE